MPYREPTRRAHSLDNRFRTPENRVLGNWTGTRRRPTPRDHEAWDPAAAAVRPAPRFS
jgi:hypothetical protein